MDSHNIPYILDYLKLFPIPKNTMTFSKIFKSLTTFLLL